MVRLTADRSEDHRPGPVRDAAPTQVRSRGYQNLDVRLRTDGDGYAADFRTAGDAMITTELSPPFEGSELELRLRRFEQTVMDSLHEGGAPDRGVRLASGLARGDIDPREFGEELFRCLFGNGAEPLYRQARVDAANARMDLRVRLSEEIPALRSVPWEFIRDPEEGQFLTKSDTPLVRFIRLGRPLETLRIDPPLRILGVTSNPSDARLDIDHEIEGLERITAELQASGVLTLDWLHQPSFSDLQTRLAEGEWHVFHFIGHGHFDADVNQGLLYLVEGAKQESAPMMAEALGDLLSDHPTFRLCVLNSCSGARGEGDDAFSSTAATLIQRGLPAVIAMQFKVGNNAAIRFAERFYADLVRGIPIDRGVLNARKALFGTDPRSLEWGTPVLHMRSPDGLLFRFQSSGDGQARPSASKAPSPPRPSTPPAPRGRTVMMYWHDQGLTRDAATQLQTEFEHSGIHVVFEQHKLWADAPDAVYVGELVDAEFGRFVLSRLPYEPRFLFPTNLPLAKGGNREGRAIGIGYVGSFRELSHPTPDSVPIPISAEGLEWLCEPLLSDLEFQQRLRVLTER